MYFERKVAAENALEDLKAIEIKMSEIRFAPEIQCESVFDERNVTTIILSKCMALASLIAGLFFEIVLNFCSFFSVQFAVCGTIISCCPETADDSCVEQDSRRRIEVFPRLAEQDLRPRRD